VFKIGFYLFCFIIALISSLYLMFRKVKPKKVEVKLLESPQQQLALEFNQFIKSHPSRELDTMVGNLNWIIKNDYQRDLRVKRVIHQDLKSLVEMSRLRHKLERKDIETERAYSAALKTIADRTTTLRYEKDQMIRDEILILSDMIKGNGR
jgi:ABC-type transport system involved in Fe-S cluster assembly fused permease/ATPase subunit